MSERTVSRAQLYADDNSDDDFDVRGDDENTNINEYAMPPPGFDFEIVDIDDNNNESNDESTKTAVSQDAEQEEAEDKEEGKEDKVEYFPLFSTVSKEQDDDSPSSTSTTKLVRVKIDDNADVDVDSEKFDDLDYDKLVELQNARIRQERANKVTDIAAYREMIEQVAVDGNTIHEWSIQFKTPNTRRVIDLNEYNAQIDLYHKIEEVSKSSKAKSRPGKKKREAKIWKKIREKEWKQKLRDAQRKAKLEKDGGKYDRYDDYKKESSKKFKFSDTFQKKRSTSTNRVSKPVPKQTRSSQQTSTVAPVRKFRTE